MAATVAQALARLGTTASLTLPADLPQPGDRAPTDVTHHVRLLIDALSPKDSDTIRSRLLRLAINTPQAFADDTVTAAIETINARAGR